MGLSVEVQRLLVTHALLTKPATFWIGGLKVFLPERNNVAVIYTSVPVAWH